MRAMATEVLHQELGQLHHSIPSSAASEMQVTKRQRRPSVRLGEIGDEPMPLVLERLFKRRKPQRSPENVTTAANEYIHQGFQENLQGEDEGTDDCLRPLLRVHVDLKKRTKRGKNVRRKCVIANQFAVDPASANGAEALKENSREIINSVGTGAPSDAIVHTDEFNYAQTEQKVKHNLWKENDQGDSLIEQEANEKLSSDGGELKPKEVDEPKKGGVQEGSMNQQPNLKEQVRDSELNTYPHWSDVSAGNNCVVPKTNEDLAAISVDAEAPALNCEVARWLKALSLGKYAYLFEVHEVDKDVLPLLTIEDLREMGIAAVGARRKLFTAIRALSCKEF